MQSLGANGSIHIAKAYEKIIEHSKEAIAICESLCGRDNINTARFYINLAWFYEWMGNEEESSRLVEIVLDILEQHKSINNIIIAQIYLTAGDIYLEKDCYNEGMQAFQLGLCLPRKINKPTLSLDRVLSEFWVWQTKINGWNQIWFQPKFLPI